MNEATPTTGNVLALDVGKARIGVAKGRFGSSLAFGHGVIERFYRDGKGRKRKRSRAQVIDMIVDAVQQEDASVLVVGLPRRSDGDDSAQTQYVREFAAIVREAASVRECGVAVVFEDERFTSSIANQQLVGSGLPKHKRQDKGRIDEGAAVLILESYLQRLSERYSERYSECHAERSAQAYAQHLESHDEPT
jgi:putative holliday junction resolvase